jgi:PAS domain S-box-containing protein
LTDPTALDRDLHARTARFFHIAAALVLVVAAAMLWSVAQAGAWRVFVPGIAVTLALTIALSVSAWWVRGGRLRNGIALSLIAMVVAGFALALATGRGLHTVTLGVAGIAVVAAAVLIGRRMGALIAVGSMVATIALYVVQTQGLIQSRADVPLLSLLLSHLLLITLGLLFGSLLAEFLLSTARQADLRQQRFGALLRIASDWYWELDADLRFTRVDAWRVPAGALGEAEALGKTRWELPFQDMAPEAWAGHIATLKAHKPFRDFVLRVNKPGGGNAYLSISGEPVLAPDGRFQGYWGVGRSVTDEVEGRLALESSERRYRDLFERTPSPLLIHRRGVVTMANRAAAAQFGFGEPQAMVGFDVLGLYPPLEHEQVRARLAALDAMPLGGELAPAELHIVGSGGELRLVQASGVRVQLADGPATLSIYFDITERKRAEAALRRSKEMLSHMFEASPDAVVLSELDTSRVLMVNGRFEALFGFGRDEIVGRRSLDLDLWVDAADRQRLVETLKRDGAVRGVLVRRRAKDGSVVPVLYSAAMMTIDGRDCFVGSMRDVAASERARLQQEAILQNASVGIAFTRNRVFVLANPEFEAMFGWMPGSLVGQPGSVVWRSAEDYAEIGRICGPLLSAGRPVDLERPMRRRDGSEFWCHVRARVVDPDNPAGGGTIWIAEDVSGKRAVAAALAAAKDEAEAANRAKSAFLANMSHEIRTPLNGVLGLARLLLLAEDDPVRRRDYLQRLIESADALSALISDTLDLAKIEAGKLTIETVKFDLQDLVESTCALHREAAADKGLLLSARFEEGAGRRVLGDPVRTRQILGNFLANAVKFTTRGRIDVAVGRHPDGRMRIAVTDTGIGIDETTQARLFEPFFQGDDSTSRRFGGTGLGLSICRSLAELMGGAVGLNSRLGTGSTFWVDLPLPAVEPEPPALAVPGHSLLPLRGVRVLVVEDNAVNMLIAEQLLLHWGAEVTQAADGRQAIEAIERAGGRFDLVLMDVHMPVMGGHEATAELRRRYSKKELPIIALTAAALVSEREQSLAAGMNDFIAKPIEADRMIEVMLRVIGSRNEQAVNGA